MTIEVEWLEEAIFDLKEIGQFIAADDPRAAYRVTMQDRNDRFFP